MNAKDTNRPRGSEGIKVTYLEGDHVPAGTSLMVVLVIMVLTAVSLALMAPKPPVAPVNQGPQVAR